MRLSCPLPRIIHYYVTIALIIVCENANTILERLNVHIKNQICYSKGSIHTKKQQGLFSFSLGTHQLIHLQEQGNHNTRAEGCDVP